MARLSKQQKEMNKLIKKAKTLIGKAKMSKPVTRLSLPSNKAHKTKKDYERKNKVKVYEIEKD